MITWLYGLLHRKREEPKPFVLKDCVLRRVFYTQRMSASWGDFFDGWAWYCSCGTTNDQRDCVLASSQERALDEWEAHASIRKRVKAGMHRGG